MLENDIMEPSYAMNAQKCCDNIFINGNLAQVKTGDFGQHTMTFFKDRLKAADNEAEMKPDVAKELDEKEEYRRV
nr:hypothetical protein [Tanacetum cinerariifolium]